MSATAEIPRTFQDSEAGFCSLFDKAPLAIAQCQRHGIITACNAGLKDLLGVDFKAGNSLRFPDLVHDHDRSRAEQILSDLFEGSQFSAQLESSSASTPHLRWTIWKVRGANSHPESAVIMAEEIAEAVSEQRLRQAVRLETIGRLAGGIAHDFNNLLTGILLYCDLLLASIESDNRARKYAEEIRKAGMQASGLVRQLLTITRSGNSQPRPLLLNEIAEGMRNLLTRLLGENIELELRLDPSLGLIRMDPSQAQQILLNLALNARDAMPGGGRITVETRNCKVQILPESARQQAFLPCALFAVEDDGPGMDAATCAHVFEPFFTTKLGKGTGLGLTTVHDIVIANGGLVHVGSAAGRGTRISVLLPLLPETLQLANSNTLYPLADGEARLYK